MSSDDNHKLLGSITLTSMGSSDDESEDEAIKSHPSSQEETAAIVDSSSTVSTPASTIVATENKTDSRKSSIRVKTQAQLVSNSLLTARSSQVKSATLSTSSTWHTMTKAEPPTPEKSSTAGLAPPKISVKPTPIPETPQRTIPEEVLTSFPFFDKELNLVYHINVPAQKDLKRFRIFTSTPNIVMKLFVPVTHGMDRFQEFDWNHVSVIFLPSRETVTHAKLVFRNSQRELLARIPRQPMELVENCNEIFVMSSFRVRDVNDCCLQEHGRQFLAYAVRDDNTVMAIDVRNLDRPYAVPLFSHLKNLQEITPETRNKTVAHMALALHHANVTTVSPVSFETVIYSKAASNATLYQQLVERITEAQLKKQTSTDSIEPQIPHPSPPTSANSNVSVVHPTVVQRCTSSPLSAPQIVTLNPLVSQQSTDVYSVNQSLRPIDTSKNTNGEIEASVVSPLEVTCDICQFQTSSVASFLGHLLVQHFSVQINHECSTADDLKCPIANCSQVFEQKSDLVLHVGIEHKRVEHYYKKARKSFESVGGIDKKIFKCPFADICSLKDSHLNVYNFVRHLTDLHFNQVIKVNLETLQALFGCSDKKCPTDGCDVVVNNPERLIQHLGIDHWRTIEFLMFKFQAISENMKQEFELLKNYATSLDFSIAPCDVMTPGGTKCGKVMICSTSRLYHLSRTHYKSQLREIFIRHSIPLTGNDSCRSCSICSKCFDVHYGALHMGVTHRLARKCYDTLKLASPPPCSNKTTKTQMETSHSSVAAIQSEKISVENSTATSVGAIQTKKVLLENSTATRTENPLSFCAKENEPGRNSSSSDRPPGSPYQESRADSATVADTGELYNRKRKPGPASKTKNASDDDGLSSEKTIGQKIFEDYLEFCRRRMFDSRTCQIEFVKVALIWALSRSPKASFDELTEGLLNVCNHHDKMADGRSILDHPLITRIIKSPPRIEDSPTPPKPAYIQRSKPKGSRSSQDPDHLYFCESCDEEFETIPAITSHLEEKTHKIVEIHCGFCKISLSTTARTLDALKNSLTLHSFDPSHLSNRWMYLNYESGIELRRSQISVPLAKCYACSSFKSVTNLSDHIKSESHQSNTEIVENYLHYCNLRDINPASCSTHDLLFYIRYVFKKIRDSKRERLNSTINNVVDVVSRLHDRHDHVQVSDMPQVRDLLLKLSKSDDSSKRIAPFVCFACPKEIDNASELIDHCKSKSHLESLESRRDSSKALFCEACVRSFTSLQNFELHIYSGMHQDLLWLFQYSNENSTPITRPRPETFCHLCEVDVQKDPGHLETCSHLRLVDTAKKFLDFCATENRNPVRCTIFNLQSFFKKEKEIDGLDKLKVFDAFLEVKVSRNEGFLTDCGLPHNREFALTYPTLSKDENSTVTTCPFCSHQYPDATIMIYHVQFVHKHNSAEFLQHYFGCQSPVTCLQCNEKFFSAMAFALHVDTHNRSVACPECKKCFPSVSMLRKNDECGINAMSLDTKQSCHDAIQSGLLSQQNERAVGSTSTSKDPSRDDVSSISRKRPGPHRSGHEQQKKFRLSKSIDFEACSNLKPKGKSSKPGPKSSKISNISSSASTNFVVRAGARDADHKRCLIKIEDLSYNSKLGHLIRTLFKKFAKSSPNQVVWRYKELRKCRKADCTFSSESVVDTFHHIRTSHLK